MRDTARTRVVRLHGEGRMTLGTAEDREYEDVVGDGMVDEYISFLRCVCSKGARFFKVGSNEEGLIIIYCQRCGGKNTIGSRLLGGAPNTP